MLVTNVMLDFVALESAANALLSGANNVYGTLLPKRRDKLAFLSKESNVEREGIELINSAIVPVGGLMILSITCTIPFVARRSRAVILAQFTV